MRIAQVALENATLQYDKLYSYLVPENMAIMPGCRVTVPFGAGNRTRLGLVMSMQEGDGARLKALLDAVDTVPLLNAELLGVAKWMRDNTFCSYYDGIRALLPPGIGVELKYTYESVGECPPDETGERRRILDYLSGRGKPVREETLLAALGLDASCPELRALCIEGALIKSQETRQKILDGKQVMVRLDSEIHELSDVTQKITAKQRDVVQLLCDTGEASLKEVCYFAAVGRTVLDRLEKAGVVRYYTREIYRTPYQAHAVQDAREIVLSPEQETACATLCTLSDAPEAKAALLHGVTGSGKTEVFLRVIRHVIQKGQTVIVMVPEIALTPQTIARFHHYFGMDVAVLHSGLSMSERMDEWKRIRAGKASIVVGTRSAVFAPVERLGLIVMDEEQEGSYKSEKAPRYHARDIARLRAVHHGALLLLASATPSVESYFRAEQGKYTLVRLKNRYGTAKLPDVHILDMSTQALTAVGDCLSADLVEQLRYNLEHGEQSILLLNRRGFQTLVKCAVCGVVASCPNCSVALTYHSANGHLMCHYCGHAQPVGALCAKCGSKFQRFSGAGTQKVQEELEKIFPEARVLRMDMDTTMGRFSHERHLGDFSDGKYDIMVGTQMVAKGLDFPNVTLVGILSADASLYAQDYRSFERAFSLFTQVVGRSGRAQKPGRAFIQTFTPENQVIEWAASQNYTGFYREEIETRQVHLYPPFCDLVGVGFSGPQPREVKEAAQGFTDYLVELAKREYADMPLRVMGPCESVVSKVAGKYRWRVVLKCVASQRFRAFLRSGLEWYCGQKMGRNVSIYVDPRCESSL